MVKGSQFSAMLMIAGLCIGGAMVGLPASLHGLGYYGAMALLVMCWLVMTYTGLLTYEVNAHFPLGCHFLTMAGHTLGRGGKIVTSVCYLALLYALIAAYLTASAEMVHDMLAIDGAAWLSSALVLVFVVAIVASGTWVVARVNRILMIVLVLAYGVMVSIVLPHSHVPAVRIPDWPDLPVAAVVALTSFGFHILIPTVRGYLADNSAQIVRAIVGGGLLALLVYVLWLSAVMMTVSDETLAMIRTGNLSSSAMLAPMFASISNGMLTWSGHYFILLAVLTSFIGVLLSLIDFLADSLGMVKQGMAMIKLLLLSLVLPLAFAVYYPHGFVLALTYAGVMVAILHGVLPALMAWQVRGRGEASTYCAPGGKLVLSLVVMASSILIIFELSEKFI